MRFWTKSISCNLKRLLLSLSALSIFAGVACSLPRSGVRLEGGRRVEYGMASWYGEKFHGRLTANGEVYDMYKVSAAHKTLPLGSKVKVTNRQNGKTIVVRINDRGPFVRGRIIDLSYGGAKALGMVEEGVVPARVETVALGDNRYYKTNAKKTASAGPAYTVQVGSYLQRENALQLKQTLESSYQEVFIREWNDRMKVFYRVRVGKFSSEEDARKLAQRLQRQNYSPFVVAE